MKIGLNLVGLQVHKWRENRGWSQATMARLLKLYKNYIVRSAEESVTWQWLDGDFTEMRIVLLE